MARAKRASKGGPLGKTASVVGIAGMSLAASASGVMAGMPIVDMTPLQGDDLSQSLMLGDEEISGVTLATFHLFDQDAVKSLARDNVQLARGCGCGHGCGGGRGCGGFRGCGGGFRGCGGGCRGCRGCGGGCGWGGWGGCWSGCAGGCCISWGGCYLC
jgi:hypothetical protein